MISTNKILNHILLLTNTYTTNKFCFTLIAYKICSKQSEKRPLNLQK